MLFCITFFCVCSNPRARGAHFRETFHCKKYSNEIEMLSGVLAFRNKWTKSENKLCLRQKTWRKRAKRDVGGHFYLQIFNVKWMSKVEYTLVVPCCCLCEYARHMGVRVDLCNRYENIEANVTPVHARQWCL